MEQMQHCKGAIFSFKLAISEAYKRTIAMWNERKLFIKNTTISFLWEHPSCFLGTIGQNMMHQRIFRKPPM